MRALRVAALVATLLTVAGCGGNDDAAQPVRGPLGAKLAQLCDDNRAAVELLGEPRDKGAAVFRPWARLGRSFVSDVRGLEGATPRQRKLVNRLADSFDAFYGNLKLSYDLFRAGRSDAIKMTLERAYAHLATAESLAVRLGAPECAIRPFEDV